MPKGFLTTKNIVITFCLLLLILISGKVIFYIEPVQASEIFLNKDLEIGAKGEDVKLLQTWLAADKEIYSEGLITGYFGSLTEQAVKRYQVANGIVKAGTPFTTGYGRVGSITKASLNSTFTGKTYGISWQEGKTGNALSLEGGYLEVPTQEKMSLENGADLTIQAWIKPSSLTWRKATILAKGSYGTYWNYGMGIENEGRIFVRHHERDVVTDQKYIKTGEWQHIAVVYSKGKDYFYYNGKLVETKSDRGFKEIPNNEALRIGMVFNTLTQGLDEAFLGVIDDVKIYSYKRSGREVESDFNLSETTAAISEDASSEPLIKFDFNEGKGTETKAEGSLETGIKANLKIGANQDLMKQQLPESTVEPVEEEVEEEEDVSTTTPEMGVEEIEGEETTVPESTITATSTDIVSETATTTETINDEIPAIHSGSGGNADVIAPSAIANLSTSNPTITSIDIEWTSPGDDGTSGTATTYDIRYSTSPITSSNWDYATQSENEPTPLMSGFKQSMTISGLTYSTTYYFAMKTSDEMQNESTISNIVNQTTNAPEECSTAVASGSQMYFVRTQNMPQIMRIDIDELSVSLWDTQIVSAQIRDTGGNPITSVLGSVLSDNGSTNFILSLASGGDTNGTWSGSWSPNDTLCTTYSMIITAISASGESNVTLSFR